MDDIAIFILTLEQIKPLIQQIIFIRHFTRLHLNLQKTIVLFPNFWNNLNKNKSPSDTLQNKNNQLKISGVEVSDEPVKYLGAFLGTGNMTSLNFEKVLAKARSIVARWRKHSLTLPARITILKTFIFSIFVHILNVVEITAAQIDTIQRILNDFLWRGKDRVKFACVCGSKDLGGLKMSRM